MQMHKEHQSESHRVCEDGGEEHEAVFPRLPGGLAAGVEEEDAGSQRHPGGDTLLCRTGLLLLSVRTAHHITHYSIQQYMLQTLRLRIVVSNR